MGSMLSSTIQLVDTFILTNMTSIVQSIVAMVTFQAYTNQTRFLWAYPDPTTDAKYLIPTGTILLSSALASAIFIRANKEPEKRALPLALVMAMFAQLFILSTMGWDTVRDDEGRGSFVIGMGIFACFTVLGVFLPFLLKK